MKFLNLDDIALDSERTIKYQGNTYKVKDFDVSEFVLFQEHFHKFSKYYSSNNHEDAGKVVVEVKELVKIGVPEFPLELVEKLNPVQMLALVSMISNLIPTADESTSEVIEEKKENPAE